MIVKNEIEFPESTKEDIYSAIKNSECHLNGIKSKQLTEDKEELGVDLPINKDNVVSGERLRLVQSITLSKTKDYLSKTFGPMGSNTKIVTGVNQAEVTSSYSKDGLKVLSNIINSAPIEASIVDELISLTRAVENKVGDGTTSTVILSSLIFDKLIDVENNFNIPPFKICRIFQDVVESIKKRILSYKKECMLDDIYNISLISTNGDHEIAKLIQDVYQEFGANVDLSVGISNTSDTIVKSYDGLTITEGMSDPAFINNKENNTSEIHDAHIYHFSDPIDTMDQISIFEGILAHNIYEPYESGEDPIPTVITCPRFSVDMSTIMKRLITQLYAMDQKGIGSSKPPILIITNVVASDEVIMDDIANLCGCKTIHKYIDPEIYKKDIEAGLAPTPETAYEFAGKAELVVADNSKTKFINPQFMSAGNEEPSPQYTAMVNFLETEIANTKASDDDHSIGLLKKRLAALKASMAELLVGGITIADRDMKRDLVIDAVKNCRSASEYGVGYAANYMGLRAAYDEYISYVNDESEDSDITKIIIDVILSSYVEISEILYGTVSYDECTVREAIIKSIERGYPYDISAGYLPKDLEDNGAGKKVLCSIELDANVLDAISKIITMMVTCNQCLLMSSAVNLY